MSEKELASLRRNLIDVAARTRSRATNIENIERSLRELTASETVKRNSLESRRRQLSSLIAALQRFALNSSTVLIAMPTTPADTIRSALLLRGTLPTISERANALAAEIKSLADVRVSLTDARRKLDEERAGLDRERAVLEGLIARKTQALRGARNAQKAAAERADRLGREATNLRDLVSRLEAGRSGSAESAPNAGTNFREPARNAVPSARSPDASGKNRQMAALPPANDRHSQTSLPSAGNLPVPGRIIGRFKSSINGLRSDGITIRTIPGATVTATRGGRIVFSGPFKGLGKLLIIEHRGAYHLLLAGLERIDAEVGDTVLAGEPVGVMSASGSAAPTLYLELRRKGQPVNPTPWLASRRNRNNG